MNVKFINTGYIPTEEERRKLDKMQELIHFTRVQYFYEIRNDSPRMQMARVEELRRMYRARWQVITTTSENPEENAL